MILNSACSYPVSEPIPFFSTCPMCHHPRLQDGYTRAGLLSYINKGHAIQAYCITCDVVWSISVREQALLAKSLRMPESANPS